MYLSKLVLNTEYPSVMSDVIDVNGMHKRIMKAFPDLKGDEARRTMAVLFRIESTNGNVVVFVQSTTEPDWSKLGKIFLEPPLHKRIDKAVGGIKDGRTFLFRLRSNPTKQIPSGKKNPKRVGLFKEDEQIAWLNRKAADGGFEVLSLKMAKEGCFRTRDGKTFESALFDGVLRVEDSERFLKIMEAGIGTGKAYGFGLLSLAPFRGT
jgi:CRISPR system Cascade subunit CasE